MNPGVPLVPPTHDCITCCCCIWIALICMSCNWYISHLAGWRQIPLAYSVEQRYTSYMATRFDQSGWSCPSPSSVALHVTKSRACSRCWLAHRLDAMLGIGTTNFINVHAGYEPSFHHAITISRLLMHLGRLAASTSARGARNGEPSSYLSLL